MAGSHVSWTLNKHFKLLKLIVANKNIGRRYTIFENISFHLQYFSFDSY